MIRKIASVAMIAATLPLMATGPADAAKGDCVTAAQTRTIGVGDTRSDVRKVLGGKGKRVMLFKWRQGDFPVSYSDFRDYKTCGGATFRVTFASPYGDENSWTVEDKERVGRKSATGAGRPIVGFKYPDICLNLKGKQTVFDAIAGDIVRTSDTTCTR